MFYYQCTATSYLLLDFFLSSCYFWSCWTQHVNFLAVLYVCRNALDFPILILCITVNAKLTLVQFCRVHQIFCIDNNGKREFSFFLPNFDTFYFFFMPDVTSYIVQYNVEQKKSIRCFTIKDEGVLGVLQIPFIGSWKFFLSC